MGRARCTRSAGQAHAGITIGTARFGNLFHTADVKEFDVTVTSGGFGFSGWLVTEVRDPYGRIVIQDERPLTLPGATAATSERYQIAGTLNGVYDVAATVFAPWRDSPPGWEAKTTIGVVPPPPTPGFDDRSAIGYYLLPDPSELPLAADIARQLQDLGIKWVRMGHREWSLDSRVDRPDVTDPAWLDTAELDVWVDTLGAYGVQVMAQLAGSARWASSDPANETDTGLGPYWRLASPLPDDWDRYVRTMAARFAGRIRHWEIWNEPDSPLFYEPTLIALGQRAVAGQRFAQLMQGAWSGLKQTDPANQVILNLVDPASTTFSSGLLPLAGNTFDAFGFHYSNGSGVTQARTLLQTSGLTPRPFWDTEAYGRSLNVYRPGKDMMPAWFRSRAAGASRLLHFIYHIIYDFNDVPGFREFGEYPVNMDYTPKPLAVAVRTLSDLVGSADYVRSFPVRTDGTLTGYIFSQAGRTVIAVLREGTPGIGAWGSTPGHKVVVKLPPGTASVTVTDLMSNTTTLTSSVGEVALPLDGNPVFVNDIDVAGDFAYLATAHATKEFLLLDVSKPQAPVERAAYNVAGNNPGRGIRYHAGLAAGITYNAGSAADFFVLSSPYGGGFQLLSSLNLGTDNSGVALYGRRAFITTRPPAQGLRVIDISTPAAPVLRATLSTGDKANAVAVRDSLPVLATSSNNLELLVAYGGVRVEPVLTDINGDGLITTSCLGDENTQSPGSPLRLWCEGLDDLVTRPTWRTRNQAVPFATVYPQDAPACGSTQLASALALDAPNAVVLAFGTADVPLMIAAGQSFNVPPPIEAIVISYRSLVASAAASQVKTFIALTPPQGASQPTQINELVAQLNNRLRHEFPGEQLIDFVAPMATQDYLPQDLDHMNQSGQSKRAAAARRELEN